MRRILLMLILTECSCRMKIFRGYEPKVFGGYPAGKSEFPHQVGISEDYGDARSVVCSGSLITTRYVLSAAHCKLSIPRSSNVAILVGTKNINKGGYTYKIQELITHPKWIENKPISDILLLKTTKKVKLLPGIVELAKLPQKQTHIPHPDEQTWTCGWGLETRSRRSNVLKKIDLYVVTKQKCDEAWEPTNENRICVVSKNHGWGTCNGDSGSGLMYKGVLIGVLSYGTEECDLNEPEVYSDIHIHLSWINSIVNKN